MKCMMHRPCIVFEWPSVDREEYRDRIQNCSLAIEVLALVLMTSSLWSTTASSSQLRGASLPHVPGAFGI